LELLAELMSCLHNILNVLQMAELLGILGLHNRSSQQMKLKLQRSNKLFKNLYSNVGSLKVKLELVNLQIRQTTLLPLQTPFSFL